MRASEVIALAKSWIGKKEADGSFKVIIDTYNKQNPLPRSYKVQYTDEWCATFISALAVQLKCTNIMPTECSCQKLIENYRTIGCWVENENRTPSIGEIIFYDWQDDGKGDNQGWSDHVGIVEKVEGSKITVIEGNYNSSVARRTLDVNGRYIRGYATPKYEKEAVVEAKPSTTTSASSTSAIKVGDIVSIAKNATYYNSTQTPGAWVLSKNWVVKTVLGSRIVVDKSEDGKSSINSPIDAKYLTIVKKATASTSSSVYYAKYTGTSTSLDAILEAIGVPSMYRGSYSKRKPVAKANGISLYLGTASQNTKLKNLAKEGKLKKV